MRTSCRLGAGSVEESFDSGSGQLGNGSVRSFWGRGSNVFAYGRAIRVWRTVLASRGKTTQYLPGLPPTQ